MLKRCVIVVSLFLVMISAGSARAVPPDGKLNAQLFAPVEDAGKFVVVSDSSILGLWEVRPSFFLNYSHEPLVGVNMVNGRDLPLIRNLTTGDFMVAVGVHEIVQAALSVPLNYSTGVVAATGDDYASATAGDARLRLKVKLLDVDGLPLGIAFLPTLTIPTGNNEKFVGNEGVTGGGFIAADYRLPGWLTEDPVTVGLNLGIHGRKSIPTGREALGSEVQFALGANVPIADKLAWITDLQTRTNLSDPFSSQQVTPLEVVTALRSHALEEQLGITLTGGAGRGFTRGMGSPVVRLFAGIQYSFGAQPVDSDGDTIPDSVDACPFEPEDFDGYQDDDGCPEPPVTYHGRVMAAGSRKPLSGKVTIDPPGTTLPYAKGYFEFVTEASQPHLFTFDAEGYKTAKVGVIPAPGAVSEVTAELDPYPMHVTLMVLAKGRQPAGRVEVVPEGASYDFENGRLEFEVDGGVEDQALRVTSAGFQPVEKALRVIPGSATNVTVTLSPLFKSMRFKFKAIDLESQTPLPVTASVRKLALTVESDGQTGRFGFTVTQPGEYAVSVVSNGYEPATTMVTTMGEQPAEYVIGLKRKEVKVVASKLVLDPVFFATGKSEILWNSYSILDSVAEYLLKNPEVRLRIEGHTDNRGNARANLRLSQQRVQSVVRYLAKKGVDAKRLEPKGFGEEQPIAPNDTEENRAKNRRVEFIVVDETEP